MRNKFGFGKQRNRMIPEIIEGPYLIRNCTNAGLIMALPVSILLQGV
jgi:hypothetical protein